MSGCVFADARHHVTLIPPFILFFSIPLIRLTEVEVLFSKIHTKNTPLPPLILVRFHCYRIRMDGGGKGVMNSFIAEGVCWIIIPQPEPEKDGRGRWGSLPPPPPRLGFTSARVRAVNERMRKTAVNVVHPGEMNNTNSKQLRFSGFSGFVGFSNSLLDSAGLNRC